MSKKRPQSASSLDALLDYAAEVAEVTRAGGGDAASGARLLSIRSIRPDLFQARRLLPPAIRVGFVTGELDAPAALVAWRALAEEDAREAELLQSQIINLAVSIRQQELVNPVTVCPDGKGGYLLETGERRWWAHWWLLSVEQMPAFEQIRARVVPQASPERQAAENLQDSPLTAVQEACQIARLLLHLSGRDTDHVVAILGQREGRDGDLAPDWIGYDPYRSALDLQRKEVYGKWSEIAEIMGRSDERHLQRQLALLKIDDGALELADRTSMTEGQLRELAQAADGMEASRQRRIVWLAAQYQLSGPEIRRLIKARDLDAAELRLRREKEPAAANSLAAAAIRQPSSILLERLRRVRRLAARHEKGGLQVSDLVDEILASGQSEVIHQEIDELAEMLRLIQEELDRRQRKS